MKKPFLCQIRHKWTVLKTETRSQIEERVDWEIGWAWYVPIKGAPPYPKSPLVTIDEGVGTIKKRVCLRCSEVDDQIAREERIQKIKIFQAYEDKFKGTEILEKSPKICDHGKDIRFQYCSICNNQFITPRMRV